MALNILFAAGKHRFADYEAPLHAALAEIGQTAHIATTTDDPASVDYIVVANGADFEDFSPFTKTKAVLNLWAGVEKIIGNPTLTQPLCRLVDTSLASSMREWVVGHTLRYHLGMDRHIINPEQAWVQDAPPLASDREVVILGLGELGQTCAKALRALDFKVSGWSRNPRSLAGVTCYSGDEGLREALGRAEILVLLLPLTAETENTLNAETLALLPEGAFVLNAGRGGLIEDEALLAALESGRVAHATLDVFRIEPLPAAHPYWAHPRVTVTPHIAAETLPRTAVKIVAENIRRGEAGQPFLYLADRTRGY